MKTMWSSYILPSIIGAEPGEADPNGEDPNGENQSTSGAGGEGQKPEGNKPDPAENGDPQKKIAAQDEIIARKQKTLEQQEAELQELREFKQQQEREKMTADEKAEADRKELESSNQKLTEGMQKLVLENAFLRSNEYQFHNPETALRLADLSQVEIVEGANGFQLKDPKSLKKALDDLVKENPYLVKSDESDKGKNDNKWQGNTGTPPKQKRENDDVAERAKLAKKYPALRNR